MADWALGGNGSVFIAQSVPLPIAYTAPVNLPGKMIRSAPLLALLATLALHALLIGVAIQTEGEGRGLPAIEPLRIEMLPSIVKALPAPVSELVAPVQPSVPRPAPKPPRATSTPVAPAAEGPLPIPREPGPSDHLAVLADEFSAPSAVATEASTPSANASEPPMAEPLSRSDGDATDAPVQVTEAVPRPTEPTAAFAAQGRWRYRVYYGDFSNNNQVAALDYVLRIEGERYRLHTEGQAVGLLALLYRGVFTQESEGAFSAGGFRPAHYAERRGDRPARTVRIEDLPGLRRVNFDDGRTENSSDSAQDRLSLAAQLSWLAANRSARLREPEITLPLIGISSVRQLRFQIARDLMLETPSGVKQLTRLRSEDGDGGGEGSVEIWVSEFGDLMPFRIRLEDRKGQILDQLLSSH